MTTTLKVLLIPFDGAKPVEEKTIRRNNLDDIYDLVAPDTRLFTAVNGTDFSMYGDDEGLSHEDVENRVNARAMELLAVSAGRGIEDFHSPLVGDWIVLGPPDEEGWSTSAPERVFGFKFSWVSARRG